MALSIDVARGLVNGSLLCVCVSVLSTDVLFSRLRSSEVIVEGDYGGKIRN